MQGSLFLDGLGLLGAALYLGSYAGLQFGVIRGNSALYTILNLAASLAVLTSLFSQWNLSSAVIQTSWVVISLVGLTRLWLLQRRLRFDDAEQVFYDTHLGALRHIDARRFMDAGEWVDLAVGEGLTTEGTPVEALFFLAGGEARVIAGSQEVARLGEGALIGEFGVLTRAPASATVEITRPARAFRITADALETLGDRNGELLRQLSFVFALSGQAKLATSNARLRGSSLDAAR
ncbi:cyclic nucleotide-binding domain-containing protein [uncultured Maritimibacter sp.]|uniref:Crp/Fnr family transcriptional regulator n=1 Tax=uncultured Maritimibacter sp. TaxID=991866 RepID=UPI002598C453|nr:cyclic nucleotide-binding domain-containing protein [uncultured Maritimibacter sp.]